jgi:hypothetical protein
MKVVCINNIELSKDSYGRPQHKTLPLTIGKVYDTSDKLSPSYIWIDNGDVSNVNRKGFSIYPKSYFVSLDVWREMQINKLI